MRKICAWCKKEISENTELQFDTISHGICKECLVEFFDIDESIKFKELIDRFEYPILVVNDNGEILSANKNASLELDRNLDEIEGFLCGVAIECQNSILSGGCGETPGCSGCELRNIIRETIETGVPVIEKTILLYQLENNLPFEMVISLEKNNNQVFIRIDDIDK